MSQKEKLIAKFFQNPKSIKYRDLITILDHFGFEKVQAKGSHVKYTHIKLKRDLIIPVHRNECHDFYKIQTRSYIREIK